jgi:metallophosphoesterase superfamily enzyme
MIPSPELAGGLIVIGHHHPLLSLRDEVGCALQTPAYLRAGIDPKGPDGISLSGKGTPGRVLFVPSFNEIAGYDILQIIKKPFSPLSRLMNKEDTEIILADGTYIGPLRALIPDEAD